MRTATQTLKLLNVSQESLAIRVFTPDLEGFRFGCNASIPDVPAVLIYTGKPDPKAKTAGEIVSPDFVPKSFRFN